MSKDLPRGLAMGLADAVPGVSGGTIALLLGIHPKLVAAFAALKPSLAVTLWQGRKAEGREAAAIAWREAHLTFLIQLGVGILVGLWVGAKTLVVLLEHYPEAMAAFFLALILVGLPAVLSRTDGTTRSLVLMGSAALFAWTLSLVSATAAEPALWLLPIYGGLAACAMILPGISGSFLLLLLGAYTMILDAVAGFDLLIIGLVGLGAVIGLLSFSQVLNGLLARWPTAVFATMAGLLIGSLGRLWPWRTEPEFAAGAPAAWDVQTMPLVLVGALLGVIIGRGLLQFSKKA